MLFVINHIRRWIESFQNETRPYVGALTLWLLIEAAYFAQTAPTERSHDVNGHLEHITLVRHGHLLPLSKECWQCYHPPLYYWLVSACGALLPFKEQWYEKCLQAMSIVLYGFFLIYACKTIYLLPLEASARAYCSWLVILWPLGIIHAPRIGNDSLWYCLTMAGLFYLTKSYNCGGSHLLWRPIAFAIMALLTKGNGIILIMTMVLVISIGAIRQCITREFYCRMLAVVTIGIALYFGLVEWKGGLWTNSASILEGRQVINDWHAFTSFSPSAYIDPSSESPPLIFSRNGYFWNFILRTSLFGEFPLHDPWHLASACYALQLLIFMGMLCGVWMILARPSVEILILTLFGGISLAALIANRHLIPMSCSGDFRYILPAIVPGAICYTVFTSRCVRWPRLWCGLMILPFLLLAISLPVIFLGLD